MIITDVSVYVKARCEEPIDLDGISSGFRVIDGCDASRRAVLAPEGTSKVIVCNDGTMMSMGSHDDLSALNSIFDVIQAVGIDRNAVRIGGFTYEVVGNLCQKVHLDAVGVEGPIEITPGVFSVPSIVCRSRDSHCRALVFETGEFHLSGASNIDEVGDMLNAMMNAFCPVQEHA